LLRLSMSRRHYDRPHHGSGNGRGNSWQHDSRTNYNKLHGCDRARHDGRLGLLLNIIAMLIVMVALVHIANALVGSCRPWVDSLCRLQRILGFIMAPSSGFRHSVGSGPRPPAS
jgi:hypothetical protein